VSAVTVNNLKKYFQVHQKEPGLWGSVKSLFSRKYEDVKAVNDISFNIEEGELVGFIGPNGAGKTTTLKCLSGLLYLTAGKVSVLDFNPSERRPEFLRQISLVMGQKNQLWWDLPAMETFTLNKEIYEVPDDQFKKTLAELVKLLEVDELTIGLDVVMQKKVRDFIKEYNRRYSATIILTSHYMGDVQELCQRVMIIDKGKLVFDGKLAEITPKYADHKLISLILAKEVDPKTLDALGKVKEFAYSKLVFRVKRGETSEVTARLLDKLPVADLNIEEPAIEDIIRELFTDKNYA